jgi:hypothetical protein
MAAVNVNIVLKHTYRANKATFSHQMNLNLNNSYECVIIIVKSQKWFPCDNVSSS